MSGSALRLQSPGLGLSSGLLSRKNTFGRFPLGAGRSASSVLNLRFKTRFLPLIQRVRRQAHLRSRPGQHAELVRPA